MEDDNTVWSVNKVIQYDPITLTPLVAPIVFSLPVATKVDESLTSREGYLRALKYFSLKSEYKKVVGHPSQKMTVDELIMGILEKERT